MTWPMVYIFKQSLDRAVFYILIPIMCQKKRIAVMYKK